MAKILVVEDDTLLRTLLVRHLKDSGHEPKPAWDGEMGLQLADDLAPDLVLLDVMLPGIDGYEVCSKIRERSRLPVIMLTAKAMEDDIVNGFSLGADDYISKPFCLGELDARVNAVLKRCKGSPAKGPTRYDDGVLFIDLRRELVQLRGEDVQCTQTEFRLLSALVQRHPGVVTHEDLLISVWGEGYRNDKPALAVYIRYLREKLEDNPCEPHYIQNVWGTGYRFVPQGEHVA